MKDVNNIYDKLEIPAAREDLESSIIEQTQTSQKKYLFPKIAVICACFVIVFSVWNNNQPETSEIMLTEDNILVDIEFFEDEAFLGEEFYDELS